MFVQIQLRKKKIEALDLVGQLEETSNIPFKDFLQSFCEYLKGVRPAKSAKNDISYLRNIFGPCCPALELGSRVPKKYRKEKTDDHYTDNNSNQGTDFGYPGE